MNSELQKITNDLRSGLLALGAFDNSIREILKKGTLDSTDTPMLQAILSVMLSINTSFLTLVTLQVTSPTDGGLNGFFPEGVKKDIC